MSVEVGVPAASIGARIGCRSLWLPRKVPATPMKGGALLALLAITIPEKTSSGSVAIQVCHVDATDAACVHGKAMLNTVTLLTGWVRNVRLVTMPKLPPPP